MEDIFAKYGKRGNPPIFHSEEHKKMWVKQVKLEIIKFIFLAIVGCFYLPFIYLFVLIAIAFEKFSELINSFFEFICFLNDTPAGYAKRAIDSIKVLRQSKDW